MRCRRDGRGSEKVLPGAGASWAGNNDVACGSRTSPSPPASARNPLVVNDKSFILKLEPIWGKCVASETIKLMLNLLSAHLK